MIEAYVMAELAGDLGAVPYYGNIGVRMVDVTTGSTAYSGTSWNGTANVTITSRSMRPAIISAFCPV
jgi:hypothetical protein